MSGNSGDFTCSSSGEKVENVSANQTVLYYLEKQIICDAIWSWRITILSLSMQIYTVIVRDNISYVMHNH